MSGRERFTQDVEQALAEVLHCAGLRASDFATKVEIQERPEDKKASNPHALLRTPLRAESIATAAIAAIGLMSEKMHTEPSERVLVDPQIAAAAIQQHNFIKVDGEPFVRDDELSGVYTTGDGRKVIINCLFPRMRDRALMALGFRDMEATERSDVERAILLEPDAFELEEKLSRAGACGAVLRSPQEWEVHPHGMAVAKLPLIEFERVPVVNSDAHRTARERLHAWVHRQNGQTSAHGLRCVDFTRVLAGPIAGRTLADLGAKVLRVSGPKLPFIGPLAILTGPGKRACEIDLDTQFGQETLANLLQGADVYINSYRRGSFEKLQLSSKQIAERYPGIVVVEIDAYSRLGPWAERRGVDAVVQMSTGIAHLHTSSLEEPEPQLIPVQFLDYVTGYLAAFATMAARHDQVESEDPSSRIIRVSLARTAKFLNDHGVKDPSDEAWKTAEKILESEIEHHFVQCSVPTGAADDVDVVMLDVPFMTQPEMRARVNPSIVEIGSSPAAWW